MSLSAVDFFNFGPRSLEFDHDLASRIARKIGLKLTFEPEVALLEEYQCEPSEPVKVSLAAHIVQTDGLSIGARLLVPLISSINSVCIPSRQVYAVRRHERSIADFFSRNLFYALARPSDATFDITDVGACEENSIQRAFQRRYLWVMRHHLSEPILHDNDVIDRLLINSRLKTLAFKSSILEKGADEVRRACMTIREESLRSSRFERLMATRDKVMATFSR